MQNIRLTAFIIFILTCFYCEYLQNNTAVIPKANSRQEDNYLCYQFCYSSFVNSQIKSVKWLL
jgi:hypothetical protein